MVARIVSSHLRIMEGAFITVGETGKQRRLHIGKEKRTEVSYKLSSEKRQHKSR